MKLGFSDFEFWICCRPPADASHRRLRAAHGLLLQMRRDPPQQPPAGSDLGFAARHRASCSALPAPRCALRHDKPAR